MCSPKSQEIGKERLQEVVHSSQVSRALNVQVMLHKHSHQATNFNQTTYERRYLFAETFNPNLEPPACSTCCEGCFWNPQGDVQTGLFSNFVFGCPLQGYVRCSQSCGCSAAGVPKPARLKLGTEGATREALQAVSVP